MSNLDPQPPIPNVPPTGNTPQPYIVPTDAMGRLLTAYGITVSLFQGQMLAASLALDEEGPYFGVKVSPEQERQWPRSFKFGWPNIIMTPDAMLLTDVRAGAFYLNYEGVVPQQIVDWVCLEAYRMTTLPFDREVGSESVTGASVHYLQWNGAKGDSPSQLDRIQWMLLDPFQMRELRQDPWPYYSSS